VGSDGAAGGLFVILGHGASEAMEDAETVVESPAVVMAP
jgi:hypothetical protein